MKLNTKTKFQILVAMAVLSLALDSFAQSIIIPTIAVVKGDTTEIPLEFVAGGGAKNLDFVMDYNPAVVDESSLGVTCTPGAIGLTTLDCHIDTVNNQVRGIGVNLPLTSLTSGVFAVISLPIFADAPSGESASSFTANFASGSDVAVTPFDTTWTPKVNDSYCNAILVSGVTVMGTELHEACDLVVVDSDFLALDGDSVFLSSGWQIEIMPGALIETGAILDAAVCGQSLCETSPDPMPNGCHSCVVEICDIDPACCDTAFSQSCLDKVNTVCGLVCE